MKRIIVLILLALVTKVSVAQRTTYHEQPGKWFNQGKELFLEGNYTAAQELLAQFSDVSNDKDTSKGTPKPSIATSSNS
jgi:outer membrane protein assembly factor BamD (BamD/ComL family)